MGNGNLLCPVGTSLTISNHWDASNDVTMAIAAIFQVKFPKIPRN